MFDLAPFTGCTPQVPPAGLLEALAEYLRTLFSAIEEAGGTPRHVSGNAVEAFWPADPSPQVAESIGAGVIHAMTAIRKLELSGGLRFVPQVGLASGRTLRADLVIGKRVVPIALGQELNLASRLSMMCRTMKKQILFPASLPVTWPDEYVTESLSPIIVMGVANPIPLMSLVAKSG